MKVETLSDYAQVGLWLLEQNTVYSFFTCRQGNRRPLMKPLRL